jgi:hypothetical protein
MPASKRIRSPREYSLISVGETGGNCCNIFAGQAHCGNEKPSAGRGHNRKIKGQVFTCPFKATGSIHPALLVSRWRVAGGWMVVLPLLLLPLLPDRRGYLGNQDLLLGIAARASAAGVGRTGAFALLALFAFFPGVGAVRRHISRA